MQKLLPQPKAHSSPALLLSAAGNLLLHVERGRGPAFHSSPGLVGALPVRTQPLLTSLERPGSGAPAPTSHQSSSGCVYSSDGEKKCPSSHLCTIAKATWLLGWDHTSPLHSRAQHPHFPWKWHNHAAHKRGAPRHGKLLSDLPCSKVPPWSVHSPFLQEQRSPKDRQPGTLQFPCVQPALCD